MLLQRGLNDSVLKVYAKFGVYNRAARFNTALHYYKHRHTQKLFKIPVTEIPDRILLVLCMEFRVDLTQVQPPGAS
jgi:hypothetical protein